MAKMIGKSHPTACVFGCCDSPVPAEKRKVKRTHKRRERQAWKLDAKRESV